MLNPDLRSIARDIQQVTSGLSVRMKIRIAVESGRDVAPRDAYASRSKQPDPATDTVVWASGTYKPSKVVDEMDAAGKVRTRRGEVEMHPIYRSFIDRAYALEIGGEGGRFAIQGATFDAARMRLRVYVKGMD